MRTKTFYHPPPLLRTPCDDTCRSKGHDYACPITSFADDVARAIVARRTQSFFLSDDVHRTIFHVGDGGSWCVKIILTGRLVSVKAMHARVTATRTMGVEAPYGQLVAETCRALRQVRQRIMSGHELLLESA